MRELRAGLWHWQAPHPEWRPEAQWQREVSSYAIDDGERLLLFDPLGVPDELLALGREPAIVLTSPWHERDTRALVERLGVPLFTARPDSAQDLIDKFGITAEQAGGGSPDLEWLGDGVEWGTLPAGVESFVGREPNDLVLLVDGAVIAGDTLVDFGDGLMLTPWLRADVTREEVVARLRPLLERTIEIVCPTHGAPADLAALRRALA